MARELGITIIAYSPLAQGATPSQMALAWLKQCNGEIVVTIPGATRPVQAEESAKAMSLVLAPTAMERLDTVGRQARPLKCRRAP